MENVEQRAQRVAHLEARRGGAPVEDRSLSRESLPSIMLASGSAASAPSVRGSMALADCFACVKLISDVSSTLPLQTFRRQGSSRARVRGNLADRLLTAPAPGVTQSTLCAQAVSHFTLWGECFFGLYRSGGEVVQVGLLAPDRVLVTLKNGQPTYRYTPPLGPVQDNLTTRDVVHCRGLSLDGLRGASPVALCRDALGLSAALSIEAASFSANASVPHGLLTVPEGPGAAEAAERLTSGWRDRLRGADKAGTVGVLVGAASFTALSMSRRDSEYVASRELSTREICRIFRVPPSLIGASSGDSLTYATSETEALGLVKFTLNPILVALEQALSSVPELFPAETYCEFQLDGLLRGDSASRSAQYTAALNPSTGWMTRAEVRALENLPAEAAATLPVAPPVIPAAQIPAQLNGSAHAA